MIYVHLLYNLLFDVIFNFYPQGIVRRILAKHGLLTAEKKDVDIISGCGYFISSHAHTTHRIGAVCGVESEICPSTLMYNNIITVFIYMYTLYTYTCI